MDKFLIFDKINFYGQHIIKTQDVLINDSFNLNSLENINEYKMIYLIYEYKDISKANELKNKIKIEIIFIVMDNNLRKYFRKQKNIVFYSYIEIYRIFAVRN
jgi:hypothetical protein